MPVNVCPASVVAAPVEVVWELLMQPETYDQWSDAHVTRIVPEGPATPGQVLSAWTIAFGKRWDVSLEIKEVWAEKHEIVLDTGLPLGVRGLNHISCAAIDERSCRLQFG